MGKVLKFFKKVLSIIKNNKKIWELLLKNLIVAISILVALHFIQLLDINIFFQFRYLIVFLISIFFLLFFLKLENSEKKIFFKISFALLLFIQIVKLTNIEFLMQPFPAYPGHTLSFSLERYGYIIDAGLFLSLAGILLTYKDSIKSKLVLNKRTTLFYVILITIIAIILRIINLTNVHLTTDEGVLLLSAKDLLSAGGFEYTRAPLLTILTAISYYFGTPETYFDYLYWARIPSAIFGALTTIPIFFLGKRISQQTGLIAAILWTISPWAIGMAQFAREYSLYSFLVTIFTLINFKFFESLKVKNKKNIVIYSTLIFTFFYYAFIIDRLSTLKYIFIIFVIFGIYHLTNYYKISDITKIRKKLLIPILLILTFIVFVINFSLQHSYVNLESLSFETGWIHFFTKTDIAPLMWYNWVNFTPVVYFFLLIPLLGLIFSKNKPLKIYFSAFILSLIFYTIFFERNWVKPRYVFYILPFFTILLSYGLSYLINLKSIFKTKSISFIVFILIALFTALIFRLDNTLYAIRSTDRTIIDEGNHKLDEMLEFLDENIKYIEKSNVIITTRLGPVLNLQYDYNGNNIIPYDWRDEERFENVHRIAEENPKGLIILDSERNYIWTEGFPRNEIFLIKGTTIETIFHTEDIQIYQWGFEQKDSII
jgi:hypothetical protein